MWYRRRWRQREYHNHLSLVAAEQDERWKNTKRGHLIVIIVAKCSPVWIKVKCDTDDDDQVTDEKTMNSLIVVIVAKCAPVLIKVKCYTDDDDDDDCQRELCFSLIAAERQIKNNRTRWPDCHNWCEFISNNKLCELKLNLMTRVSRWIVQWVETRSANCHNCCEACASVN